MLHVIGITVVFFHFFMELLQKKYIIDLWNETPFPVHASFSYMETVFITKLICFQPCLTTTIYLCHI